jgi:hypothetical protein
MGSLLRGIFRILRRFFMITPPLQSPQTPLSRWLWSAVTGLIFFITLVFSLSSARQLAQTPIFDRDDAFFRCDSNAVFFDFAEPRLGCHTRNSLAHPNFTLLHHPLGAALTAGLTGCGMAPERALRQAVTLLSGGAAAATAALCFMALGALRVRLALAGPLALGLGFSSASAFFGAVPETWIFTGLSLMGLLTVLARGPAARRWEFPLAAFYAISCLTANLAIVGLLLILKVRATPGEARPTVWATLVKATVQLALLTAVAMGVCGVQRLVYPQSGFGFNPSTMNEQRMWLDEARWAQPVNNLQRLGLHFIANNIIGPTPRLKPGPHPPDKPALPMGSIEKTLWSHWRPHLYAVLPWMVLLGMGGLGLGLRTPGRSLPLAATAALTVLGFSVVFYSTFGNDRMLYAASWTGAVMLLTAYGLERVAQRWPRMALGLSGLALVTSVLIGVRNAHFIRELTGLLS